MKVAIIMNRRFRKWVFDLFQAHPELDVEIIGLPTWDPTKEKEYNGVPVISLRKLKEMDYDAVVVVLRRDDVNPLMIKLHNENINNVYVVKPLVIARKIDFLKAGFQEQYMNVLNLNSNIYMELLDVHVCDDCNLNCKGCTHFSPFVKERTKKDVERYEKELRRLKELYSHIGQVTLLGGEPLLEPELCMDMARVTRRYFPNAEIAVLTNGILIPKMTEKFWAWVRELEVIMVTSLYPPFYNKGKEYANVLRDNGIQYTMSAERPKFTRFLTLSIPQNADKEYLEKVSNQNYKKCISKGCHVLQDGYLAHCPIAAHMCHMATELGCTPEELRSKDSVWLEDAIDGWDVLRRLEKPCDSCVKCDYNQMKMVDWEVCGKHPNPKDWLLEGIFPDYMYELK